MLQSHAFSKRTLPASLPLSTQSMEGRSVAENLKRVPFAMDQCKTRLQSVNTASNDMRGKHIQFLNMFAR